MSRRIEEYQLIQLGVFQKTLHVFLASLLHMRKFWKKRNFQQAVIKLAGSAASRKTKSLAPGERPVPHRPQYTLSGAPLELGPLDLVFWQAALAADLMMA